MTDSMVTPPSSSRSSLKNEREFGNPLGPDTRIEPLRYDSTGLTSSRESSIHLNESSQTIEIVSPASKASSDLSDPPSDLSHLDHEPAISIEHQDIDDSHISSSSSSSRSAPSRSSMGSTLYLPQHSPLTSLSPSRSTRTISPPSPTQGILANAHHSGVVNPFTYQHPRLPISSNSRTGAPPAPPPVRTTVPHPQQPIPAEFYYTDAAIPSREMLRRRTAAAATAAVEQTTIAPTATMATPDLATITERMKVVTDALHDRRSRMEFRDLPEDDDNPKDENERPRNLLLTSRRAPRVVKPLRSTVGASMSLCGGRGLPSERGSFLKNPKTGFTKMKIKVEHVGSVDDDFVLGDLLREYDYRLREVEGMMFGAGKKVDLTFLDEVVGRIEEALEMHLGQDSDCLRGSAKHNAESVHSAAEDDRNDGGHAMAQGGSIEDHDML